MTALCKGKCGRAVTTEGMWCFICWSEWRTNEKPVPMAKSDPVPHDPAIRSANLRTLIAEIHDESFKLRFGPESGQTEALDKLLHFAHVLRTKLPTKA